MENSVLANLVGRSPGATWKERFRKSALRALRTLIQGVAAAFPAGGVGAAILSVDYWNVFLYSVIAALITALVSFLNNIASFLPTDTSQK